MRFFPYRIFFWIVMRCLRLRYDIQVKNKDILKGKGKKTSYLFLPNHPAEVDPVIIYTLLSKTFNPRSIAIDHFYHMKGVHFFMKLVRAIPVPNIEISANKWKLSQIEKCFLKVKKEIEEGENFLIYPSGRLKRGAHEEIGGSSFIHRVLQEVPDVKVVLVRTTGLWGSQFSRAITGEAPNPFKVLWNGAKTLLKSGIFFLPKRNVQVEFSLTPNDFPYKGDRK